MLVVRFREGPLTLNDTLIRCFEEPKRGVDEAIQRRVTDGNAKDRDLYTFGVHRSSTPLSSLPKIAKRGLMIRRDSELARNTCDGLNVLRKHL